jgi:hypothetical protein
MKQVIYGLCLLFFSAHLAWAHDEGKVTASTDDLKNWYIGVGAGADVLGSNWTNFSTLGSGAEGIIGYQLDPNWAIQADVEHWTNTGSTTISGSVDNLSQDSFRGLLCLKFTFSTQFCQPYLLAGGGLTGSSLNILGTASTATNADVLGGFGLQFDLSQASHFFVQGKYNFILTSNSSSQDVPITAGIWTGL